MNASQTLGFAPSLKAAAAKQIFECLWKKLGESISWINEKIAIQKAVSAYFESYLGRYGQVKVLGMSQPVPLLNIFTSVRVIKPDFLFTFSDVVEMERSFKSGHRALEYMFSEAVDGIHAANSNPSLNILGQPGAGKSTLLRRIGIDALLPPGDSSPIKRAYKHEKFPVFLELRRFSQAGIQIDITSAIISELSTCGFPKSEAFVKECLDRGAFLVLLDGLDEINVDRLDESIDAISNFTDKYSPAGNRFITSCRTAHYKNYFTKFVDVVLAEFSDIQIESFAGNWFSSPSDRRLGTSSSFIAAIRQNASILELARTPLLLAFLCLTFDRDQELPTVRARLYDRALDIMLREWAAEKRVHRDPVYKDLHTDLEKHMLAEVAARFFADDRFFFSRSELLESIESFSARELNSSKLLDASIILKAIEIQQGIIVQRSQDHWSFSHLTIQEYLTAFHFWSEGSWQGIIHHLDEARWREVFVMLAGMGKSDGLVVSIAKQLHHISRSCEWVWALFEWVDRICSKSDHVGPAAAGLRGITASLGVSLIFELADNRNIWLSRARARAFARSMVLNCGLNWQGSAKLESGFELEFGEEDLSVSEEGLSWGMETQEKTLSAAFALGFDVAEGLLIESLDDDADAKSFAHFVMVECQVSGMLPEVANAFKRFARGSITLAHAIEEMKIPKLPADDEEIRSVSVFNRYIDGVQLLVNCRSGAYRLTTEAWSAACGLLFAK